MKKNKQTPALYYRDLLNSMMKNIKEQLSYLKEELPLKADELTRRYCAFKENRGELLKVPNRTLIYLPIVLLAIVGLYILDQALLSDVYDFIVQFSGKDLPPTYRKAVKLAFPLVVLLIYAFGIEGHSVARQKHEKAVEVYQNEQNPVLDVPNFAPNKPFSLYVTSFLKYIFPLFIVMVAMATYLAQGGAVNLLLSSAMYWIALISHLLVIFFGESGLKSIKVSLAKLKSFLFWKKRRSMENAKIKLIAVLSNLTDNWYDKREHALALINDVPNLPQMLRSRFRNDEMQTLQRITGINFGVAPDSNKPLFPYWDDCPDDKKKPTRADEVQGEAVQPNNTTQDTNQVETPDVETDEGFADLNDDADESNENTDFSTIIDDNEKIV